MNTWFTSDWHFNHRNILSFCERPFSSVEEMNEGLIYNHNLLVREHDTVYHLGDLTLGSYAEVAPLIQRLKGKKILIQGNHDKFSQAQYQSLGFSVYEDVVIRLVGRRIRLSHYPRLATPEEIKEMQAVQGYDYRYMERRPVMDGKWLLHGHTHDKERINPKKLSIHVGVDAWDFKPASLRAIESLIATHEKSLTTTP